MLVLIIVLLLNKSVKANPQYEVNRGEVDYFLSRSFSIPHHSSSVSMEADETATMTMNSILVC